MGQSSYAAPTYVSDGDIYYSSDFNQYLIDNLANMRINSVQYSSEIDLGDQATDFSVNFGNGNRQAATLTGNADITLLTSDLTCGNYTLVIDGDGFTYTFDCDAVKAPGGTVSFTVGSDTGEEDIIGLYYTDRDSDFRMVVSTNII